MDKFTTEPSSNLCYTQEILAEYRFGGYHPVSLGDTFADGRYEVVHKLGWGGFSTVWLARNTRDEKWVALKICKAETDSLGEISTLRMLQGSPASGFVAKLYESFVHDGPNGSHLCIVTEFLGPSLKHILADYDRGGDRLAPEDTLRLSRQLLQATAAVHEAGVAHGDINGGNIVFTTSRLASLSKEEIFEIVGEPETAQLLRKDGSALGRKLPKQLVGRMKWTAWIDEGEEDIRLIDWGESFAFDSPPRRLAQPADWSVPETIFTSQIDYRVDLWRAGIVIYCMISAHNPFHWWGHIEALACEIIGFSGGEVPSEWRERWQQMQADATTTIDFTTPRPSLLDRYTAVAPEPELAPLVPMMQALIKLRPTDRISAREALALFPPEGPEAP